MVPGFLRTFVLFLCFTVEVQIHASQSKWLAEPANCTYSQKACAMRARADKAALSWEDAAVAANKGTVLTWSDSQVVELVSGAMLLRLTEGKRLKVPMATVFGAGEIIVERNGNVVDITCLRGEVFVRALGVAEELRLPAGYRQHLDAVSREGHAETGIPMTAPVASSIKTWWSLYQGQKSEFLPLAKEFARTVNTNVDAASHWHANLVERELANQAEAERVQRERRERELKEQRQYKELFRKMNYVGDELPD